MTSTLRKYLVMALGVAALLAADVVPAVTRPAGPSPKEQLRRDTEAIHALGVSGVQARVIAPDGRESVATSGTADLNTGSPVPSHGYFRMASTSKTLVAGVVLQLEAEGRLSLNDTVDRRLPGVVRGKGNDGSRITIRQLLQHTSGIHDALPGYTTPAEYHEQRHTIYEPEELVDLAMAHEPDFPPGKGWAYSNTGYVLLDMIIEKATGHPAHQEIQDRILSPLGLDQTRWMGTSPTLPWPHARAYQLFGPASRVDVTDQIPVDYDSSIAAVRAWALEHLGEPIPWRIWRGGRRRAYAPCRAGSSRRPGCLRCSGSVSSACSTPAGCWNARTSPWTASRPRPASGRARRCASTSVRRWACHRARTATPSVEAGEGTRGPRHRATPAS
jgi:CubicO group peptidase (beta-lactamase class C family)